jgi:GntR family transcriptional regulator / MocR family aminotransferase
MAAASSLELSIALDPHGTEPLHRQLQNAIRMHIRAGQLIEGARMPSSRRLADDLGVSRRMVVDAYEQLIAEGYLTARQGSGTRVARTDRPLATPPRSPTCEPAPTSPRYDFRPGVPELAAFPRAAWGRALRRQLRTVPKADLHYPHPQGHVHLREALADYLGRVRQTRTDAAHLLICSGFTQALTLLCQALRRAGATRIAMEDPGLPSVPIIVRAQGLHPVPIPVDQDGIDVNALTSATADAVVVTPAHQFPTGVVLAPHRREALLRWVREGHLVIEDDYDAEFRYDRFPVGALQGLAPEHVILAGTISKTLCAAMRLGWLALPSSLVTPVTDSKQLADHGCAVLDQLALAEFLTTAEYDRHVRAMRGRYRNRRDALTQALHHHAPELRLVGASAGLHLLAELPPERHEAAVLQAAARDHLHMDGLARYRHTPDTGRHGLVLGYGNLATTAVEDGARLIARAVAGCAADSRGRGRGARPTAQSDG